MDTETKLESGKKTIDEWQKSTWEVPGACPKCGEEKLQSKIWKSTCGGYRADYVKCESCNNRWWKNGWLSAMNPDKSDNKKKE